MEFQARHPKLFLLEALNIRSLVLWGQVGHLPLGYVLCVSAYSAKACCGLMLSPWDSPFQSESRLPFPGSQNLPLVPSYLSVPLEDDQQALYKPGLFGGIHVFVPPLLNTMCCHSQVPAEIQECWKADSRNGENF